MLKPCTGSDPPGGLPDDGVPELLAAVLPPLPPHAVRTIVRTIGNSALFIDLLPGFVTRGMTMQVGVTGIREQNHKNVKSAKIELFCQI
jgi:hypothetical protein